MAYWVNHLLGNAEQNFSLDSLPSLYDELAAADGEHTDVLKKWGQIYLKSPSLQKYNLPPVS